MTSDDEIRRQFEAMIANMDTSDIASLTGSILDIAGQRAIDTARKQVPPRPTLRKEKLPQPVLYRVRIDLDNARPPIWRRLEIRSDLTLDLVHRVIQGSFDWLDYHLHRFALGGSPFDRHSELFLCPFDVDEGEEEGTPLTDVRLDETLHAPGDTLRYIYDYGDSWKLTLCLEAVLPLPDDAPVVRCIDGRRAAPPEDCGGYIDEDDLATVVDDPAHFDAAAVNEALANPIPLLSTRGVDTITCNLLYRLDPNQPEANLAARVQRFLDSPPAVSDSEFATYLRP